MSVRLNKQKAVEATGVLLKCAPNSRMTRLRLIKLLYIADRESIAERGRPITWDRYVAMEHGPVLSGVYDMIKNTHADPHPWQLHIRSEHDDVVLLTDPGVGDLSRFEVRKLQEVWSQYEDKSEWHIVDFVVHKFPEWMKYEIALKSRGSITIPFEEVAAAVGRSDASELWREAVDDATVDQFWQRVTA